MRTTIVGRCRWLLALAAVVRVFATCRAAAEVPSDEGEAAAAAAAFGQVFAVCERQSAASCERLSACVAEQLVNVSRRALDECRLSGAGSGGSTCNLAAIAYVTVEQLRQLLLADDSGHWSSVTSLRRFVHRVCKRTDDVIAGGEPGDGRYRGGDDDASSGDSATDAVNQLMVSVGRRLQQDATVNSDIVDMQRRRNRDALWSLAVCFAAPALFAFCEPSHVRATFALQLVALVVVTGFHLVRCNFWLAAIGFGSCGLIFAVEIALLVLLHAKTFRGERRPP